MGVLAWRGRIEDYFSWGLTADCTLCFSDQLIFSWGDYGAPHIVRALLRRSEIRSAAQGQFLAWRNCGCGWLSPPAGRESRNEPQFLIVYLKRLSSLRNEFHGSDSCRGKQLQGAPAPHKRTLYNNHKNVSLGILDFLRPSSVFTFVSPRKHFTHSSKPPEEIAVHVFCWKWQMKYSKKTISG